MGSVILHLYAGDPPGLTDIANRFGLTRECTFLTANSAIERRRLDEFAAPDALHLRPTGQQAQGGPVLAFNKAVRHVMATPVFSRTEERVLFRRAIAALGLPGTEVQRLRRDARLWVEALAALDARGVPFDAAAVAGMTVAPELDRRLAEIGAATRALQTRTEEGRLGFERTAWEWIAAGAQPIQRLVMEGFTFLTPLQRALIGAVGGRAPVDVLVPYRPQQTRLFEQIKQTYGQWWDSAREWPAATSGGAELVVLQNSLFELDARPLSAPSVQVRQYQHVHDEVHACIQGVAGALAAGASPHEMAIVVPNRNDFDALLQEEAALQELPVSLGVPPRLLLLTPVGRFILELYNASQGGAVSLTATQFETMLSSGWLGALAQRSVHEFRAVKNQLFARCTTVGDWESVLEAVAGSTAASAEPARQAIDWLDAQHVAIWRDALDQIVRLVERLFEPGERSIGEHVRRLLEALDELPDEHVLRGEREVILRVKEALTNTAEATSLAVESEEFAEVLTGLATEYEEATTTEEAALEGGQIWVTTPEGVDGVRREYVFVLGMDASKMPRAVGDAWPLMADAATETLTRERYIFGTALRAATRSLTITSARRTADAAVVPTPFLLAAGLKPAETPPAPPGLPPTLAPEHAVVPAKRERYSFTELAHFGLCPYRYKLEHLEPRSRRYTSPLHVPLLAQGRWIDLTLQALRPGGEYAIDALPRAVLTATEEVRERVLDQFPALSNQDLRSTAVHVRSSLDAMMTYLAGNKYGVRFTQGTPQLRPLERGGRVQFLDIAVRHVVVQGIIPRPITSDLVHEEWLRPERTASTALTPDLQGMRLFADRRGAFTWWRETARAAYGAAATRGPADIRQRYQRQLRDRLGEAEGLIQQVEAGRFPRRPGDHCQSCPVLDDCLGRNP